MLIGHGEMPYNSLSEIKSGTDLTADEEAAICRVDLYAHFSTQDQRRILLRSFAPGEYFATTNRRSCSM